MRRLALFTALLLACHGGELGGAQDSGSVRSESGLLADGASREGGAADSARADRAAGDQGSSTQGGLRVVGSDFYQGQTKVILRGINDPIVFPLGLMGEAKDRYRNQEFPGSLDPATFQTIFAAASEQAFWREWGTLLKERYGLNLLRAGGHDSWGLDVMHSLWWNNKARFYQILDNALAGLAEAGVYLLFEFGGMADAPYSAGNIYSAGLKSFDRTSGAYRFVGGTNQMEGHLFAINSEAFNHYTDYIADVIKHIAGKPALAGIEILNEPDHDQVVSLYWSQLGDASPTGPRMTAYVAWVDAIAGAVVQKSGHGCPVSMGHAAEGLMFDEDWFSGEWCKRMNASTQLDFSQYHKYMRMTGGMDKPDDSSRGYFYMVKPVTYLKQLGKPVLMSEWGSLDAYHGFYNYYVPEYAQWLDHLQVSWAAMRLHGHPDYPP